MKAKGNHTFRPFLFWNIDMESNKKPKQEKKIKRETGSVPNKKSESSDKKKVRNQVTLSLPHPDSQTRKDYIKQVEELARKKARETWDTVFPQKKAKGGRPTLEGLIWKACDQIYGRYKGKRMSQNAWIEKVQKQISLYGKKYDDRTIKKHWIEWTGTNLTRGEIPESWLQRPHTLNGIIAMETVGEALFEPWNAYLENLGPGEKRIPFHEYLADSSLLAKRNPEAIQLQRNMAELMAQLEKSATSRRRFVKEMLKE